MVIQLAQQFGCQRIGLKDALTTQDLVQKIKQAGLACSVWTVNDVRRVQELADWQVDGLITDAPNSMLQANISSLNISQYNSTT